MRPAWRLYFIEEEILRRALKRCLLEGDFRCLFDSDAAVASNFPLW